MIRFLARLQPWALTLVRLVLGISMAYHGSQKLIPPGGLHRGAPLAGFEHFSQFVVTLGMPYWLGCVSVVTEFAGGIFILFGLLTRFWALMIAGNMMVALFWVNFHHGYAASEYTLALIVMALLLVTTGAGALALDRRFGLA